MTVFDNPLEAGLTAKGNLGLRPSDLHSRLLSMDAPITIPKFAAVEQIIAGDYR